jgi:putative proteasome-type protease
MDSTLKSNLSVGLPLDLVVYEQGKLETDQIVCIDEQNPYFRMIRSSWGQRLRDVFESMEDPQWDPAAAGSHNALIVGEPRYDELKKIRNPDEKVV